MNKNKKTKTAPKGKLAKTPKGKVKKLKLVVAPTFNEQRKKLKRDFKRLNKHFKTEKMNTAELWSVENLVKSIQAQLIKLHVAHTAKATKRKVAIKKGKG